MPAKIGLDCDGVVAAFAPAYAKILTKLTGVVFPVADPAWPATWFWDRDAGITPEQESAAWQQVLKSHTFWANLAPLPGAKEAARLLNKMTKAGHEVFWITNRPGTCPKLQTEKFLYNLGINYPTVIVAADKLPIISALKLDFYCDDRAETIISVAGATKNVNNQPVPVVEFVFLREAPYNVNFQYPPNVRKAPGILEALLEVYGN